MSDLCEAVRQAAGRPEVGAAVDNVYRAVGDAIDLRRPTCVASGRCCRFEEFGHRLYVTTLELATFVRQAKAEVGGKRLGDLFAAWDDVGCPFQVGALCGVHAIRPFGCRIFFCDATAAAWQQRQYEFFHAELKRLHGELEVPYFYVEWRQGLREARALLAPASSEGFAPR